MHLLDYRKLATALASDRLSELDSLKYYAAGTLLAIFNQQIAAANGNAGPALFVLDCVILLVASLAGISHCWRQNGGKAGRDFALRMVCLSVPASVRMTLLYLLVTAALYSSHDVFYGGSFASPYRAQVIFSYGAFIGLLFYFWDTLGQAMRIAAKTTDVDAQ